MNVTLYMAMSVNGYIATSDGKEDFLSHENWNELVKLANEAGCLVWGRKTYQQILDWGQEYLTPLNGIAKIILTNNPNLLFPGCEIVTSPQEALKRAETLGFSTLLISGGATVNSAFMREGLFNRLVLNVESVLVGSGTPLFKPYDFIVPLTLVNSKKITSSITQFEYAVG